MSGEKEYLPYKLRRMTDHMQPQSAIYLICREAADEIERLQTLNVELLAAAEDALSTFEALELLNVSRVGIEPKALTKSCNMLHTTIEKAERP